jgi:DNA-binding transcriptional regulator YdaS (Cro superfamily)
MAPPDTRIAPEAATDEPASPANSAPSEAEGLTGFDPIPLRYRKDGLTPDKQREYVEALADTGIAKEAAARIGVSEQAVNRARRRADARSFDLACEAAVRIAAKRVRSIAFERAIEGTIKRHYYHGELKCEERVYDNRLLVYLLGKIESQIEPPPEAEAIAANWEPWMAAIEQGLPCPPAADPEEEADAAAPETWDPLDPERPFDGGELWQSEGEWWTAFPPPADFDGLEEGHPRRFGYKRTLSEAERAVIDAEEAEERAGEIARRDRYFGFAGGTPDPELFSPWEAETYETSAPHGAEPRTGSGVHPASDWPDDE